MVMKKEELIKALNEKALSRSELKNLEEVALKKAENYLKGNEIQMVYIAFEETAELQQALTKSLRNKEDKLNILEEYVDVILGIKYLSLVYNLKINTNANYQMSAKMDIMKVCHHLTNLQESIYETIKGNQSTLKNKCIKTLKELSTIKTHYEFTDEQVNQVMVAKLKRLINRIENAEKI